MSDEARLHDILNKIADLARNAASEQRVTSFTRNVPDHSRDTPGCSIKAVPTRLLRKAASNAIRLNPTNAPMMAPIGGDGHGVLDPLSIAVMTTKYWGTQPRQLTVSFMDDASSALRDRILSHMNAWTSTGCISFVETSGTGNVRIAFGPTGHWSYLGTDILSIPTNRPTMNLQAFDRETRDSEFHRVVRHETGHTLGFPHEHMRKELVARIDRQKAYAYFWATQRWNQAMVDAQVLTPLADDSLFGTPPDQTSIMCYQLPASITLDGQPIIGGIDINATDYAFNGQIYPKQSGQTLPSTTLGSRQSAVAAGMDDWAESEDAHTLPLE
ncbi:MAG TPA: M12 family metallopeptidase [Planctomycetaceae bacterium]|jgi:hypothetical protein|nr:M12 family metallopeptidase [Planctomycetaceae bacterium]